MYQAELHGKLSPRVERMEDILTSNVFSFFKYSNRAIFLKGYLNKLGLNMSAEEAKDAEFLFWPHFEDNTEPDLVIIIGNYYLLIEAKYFSEFGGETDNTKAQLLREIDGGKLEAKSYAKTFRLIAITADNYFKKDKFQDIPAHSWPKFIWTNWQLVASFLNSILETNRDIKKEERDFASDLCMLLDKKNLRGFQSFEILYYLTPHMRLYDSLFFDAKTAQFRGDFIGFPEALSFDKKILPPAQTLFFRSKKRHFTHLLKVRKLQPVENSIFYRGDTNHGGEK